MSIFQLSPWLYLAAIAAIVISLRVEIWWNDRRDAKNRIITARRATNIVELLKLMQAPTSDGAPNE